MDQLIMPRAFMVMDKNCALVGAPPNLFRACDTNGDLVADPSQALLIFEQDGERLFELTSPSSRESSMKPVRVFDIRSKQERDKWNQRLTRILMESRAPVVEGMTEVDARAVVEMAVGRSCPSTVTTKGCTSQQYDNSQLTPSSRRIMGWASKSITRRGSASFCAGVVCNSGTERTQNQVLNGMTANSKKAH
jgi:hypothetical protein